MPSDERELTAALCRLSRQAGAAIMRVYESDFDVRIKADSSPVTDADEQAEAIILRELERLTPDIPVLAEERASRGGGPDSLGPTFWLVDPLDGTKEFVNRNGEFTVNVALVRNGVPVLGAVYAPALDRLFYASGPGDAWAEDKGGPARAIAARPAPPDGLVAVVSRSHYSPETDDYLNGFTVASKKPAGSSLKFCLVAAGEADIYPRLGPTHEWDTAAGHAVVLGAGGRVETLDGKPLTYGKADSLNPAYVARGL